MKFKFKIQQYQSDAVESTVSVFAGQPSRDTFQFRRDLGKQAYSRLIFEEEYTGYRNSDIELNDQQLLDNIRKIQEGQDIKQSPRLVSDLGRLGLDIEMETGTGKTYVYIKTMFEMNKRYGWNKFIVVVPSIAIREGVFKSFTMLEDHFMEHYGKKARFFIYNSSNLQQLDSFSSDAGINVMIINCQAFNTSLDEERNQEGRRGNQAARIIYSVRDDFGSRKPIDVIAANRPIIIMDEPQKMEGQATQKALKRFNPLFVLYYSATHKTQHNCIYALDALDAFKQKLVKKIQVKGFEVRNLKGTSSYLYLDDIILSKNQPPMVRLEIEVETNSGVKKMMKKLGHGDSLYSASGLMEYKDFTISDIDAFHNSVTFLNGVKIAKGEVYGDSSEEAMQRVQIRETIASHFEKERDLFKRGIKTLSLFFVDEVAHYKSYNDEGEEIHGTFWRIFEEEYTRILNDNLSLFDDDYQQYLRRFDASQVHNGYFSIDKKGHAVNSSTGRGTDISDDISAYDLILKNKERLLSFDEPTRFIFSHSALREGWDNPNVFQICTLRHAASAIAKRQEVGRGLRICVDQQGNRMDLDELGEERVHDINKLTVIANESYKTFVDDLQNETREALRERPNKAVPEYFQGKIILVDGAKYTLDAQDAMAICGWLAMNDYSNENYQITQTFKDDLQNGTLEPMGKKLAGKEEQVITLIKALFDDSISIEDMIEDGNAAAEATNRLNENFSRKEFQALWNEINHKYVYTVHYDSNELIEKAVAAIDKELAVTELKYVMTIGDQDSAVTFGDTKTTTQKLGTVSTSTVKYDLVGEVAKRTTLTRRTTATILKKIRPSKLAMFRNNPEEFIKNVSRIIRNEKATMIVEHIQYDRIDQTYDSDIFTQEKHTQNVSKSYSSKKHIMDYVFTDSDGERTFAKDLDAATEVCVYAKLPRSFQIPTPVGNYAPDWAIAFNDGTVKHIFFIAETKGSMDSMQLKKVEDAKIGCAEKLFNDLSTSKVRYHKVDNYQTMLDILKAMD
ncbi:MAG: DEAD/DEAH box helicase family protein [Bacteroidales bacterium]|nr:DEAD/DEAH box helicase family protein [Bacteroidales bacterium]